MVEPVVTVKQGWLRGGETRSIVGGSFISFKGIPFAQPPVGDLRFKDPQPPLPWSGIRDALKQGPKCLQPNMRTLSVDGEEDCLYLNVATTSLKGSRPVMVWIHGGAFVYGNGGTDFYSPDYLMKTDIVFVSINYRIGVLGFLHLDHEVAPGNMGLKDQVAALKWVKENIAQFGGDPNNITIFGVSAGSASVHYLLLSPLAKGLFHKAILQSGVALNPWACTPTPVDFIFRYVAALGKETTDPHEMIEYLRTVPAHKLIEAQEAIRSLEDEARLIFPFRPNIDDKSEQPFMPRTPRELAVEGVDVPLLMGYTSHEGLVFCAGLTNERLASTNEKFDITVTHNLIGEASSKIPVVAKEIRKFYFGDKKISRETLKEYVKCYGDIHFKMGVQNVIEFQQKKKTSTYFYKFAYNSPKSFGKVLYNTTMEGASHSDDTAYLFYPALFGDTFKTESGSIKRTISDRLVRMWTDFAKTGNPTPKVDDLITVKWEPITWTTKNCMVIDEELSTTVNPDDDVCELFKRISDIVDGCASSFEMIEETR